MEEWRNIRGYEGLYQVSSIGRVRNTKTGRVLKGSKDNHGYLKVDLYKNNTRKSHKVHRLVAKAFVENPKSKPCIDHINTIKTDNYFKNLRWVSYKENNNNELTRKHSSEARKAEKNPMHGKHHSEESRRKMSEAKIGEANYKSKRVEIFKNEISLGIFPCTMELERQSEELFGKKLLHSSISAVCLGKRKSHKGFQFKFVD